MGQPHESKGSLPAQPQGPRLLDRVREAIRRKHYSRRTEETYIHWIKRFIYFSGKRHPAQDNPREGGRAGVREMEEKRDAISLL
jgi:hypothetical protein